MGSIALLDWDNTIRPGFLLREWIQFLKGKVGVDRDSYDQLVALFENYRLRRVSYHDLARLVAMAPA